MYDFRHKVYALKLLNFATQGITFQSAYYCTIIYVYLHDILI